MGSSAGPYQMDREPGAPFGMFNLAKFRAEVRSRVDVARTGADTAGSASYMNTTAYDSPPPRTAGTHSSGYRGSQSADRAHIESRMMSRDGDEAYEKMQRRAESTLGHSHFPPVETKEASARRSVSSLDVIRAPRSTAFLSTDPLKPDRLQWTTPEKWYSLSRYSAQNHAQVSEVRNQTQRPALPTMPSQNPFSLPPSRINKFSDVSANPRLIDGKKKKRRNDESSPVTAKVGIAKFGHMRKCQNPFTEGWKVATFKPAREKLVPYTATVKKWMKGVNYGFIDLDGQTIFVHQSAVRGGQSLRTGDKVVFHLQSGITGRRGLPEAQNVIKEDPDADNRPAGEAVYSRKTDSDDDIEYTWREVYDKRWDSGTLSDWFYPRDLDKSTQGVPWQRPKHMPEDMNVDEYEDLLSRRKLDEDLRGMFDTSFWKYPKSEETLPPEEGGLTESELHERNVVSKNFTPYEQSISFDRKMTMVNPLTDEQAARKKPPAFISDDNGPDLKMKLHRKPWLSKFLTKSTSRHPLARPDLMSYYTSPVVNSTDRIDAHTRAKATKKDVHEMSAMSPTNMRLKMNPAPAPPIPVRNDKLRDSRSGSLSGSSFDFPPA